MEKEELSLRNDYIQKEAYKYGFVLSEGQINIVRKIVFMESKRISISCYTRYGKTQCVALAIAILIDKGTRARVAFIGPGEEQAGILRQYMAELITIKPSLLKKADLKVEGVSKIQKEASRKRMTFNTGAEYRVFSAEGEAKRIMGFGVDKKGCVGIIVKDEACLIKKVADVKIGRMMGANPDNCMLIELYNPWERDNIAFENTLDPNFDVTHIDWRQGVKEGRTKGWYVEEQRKRLSPLEFEVLWESKFPSESEDSIFNLDKIGEAEARTFNFEEKLQELERALDKRDIRPERRTELENEIKDYERIISCDPADMGLDFTVMYWGTRFKNKYQLVGYYEEPKSDSMNLVGKIMIKAGEFIKKSKGRINLDRIGIGTGPLSRIRELVEERSLKNIEVFGCHFGEAAVRKDHFVNKKAENYFRLRDIFNEEFISLIEIKKLKYQLVSMKWEHTSAEKKRVIDPEKSPDFADALVYFTWREEKSRFIVGSMGAA